DVVRLVVLEHRAGPRQERHVLAADELAAEVRDPPQIPDAVAAEFDGAVRLPRSRRRLGRLPGFARRLSDRLRQCEGCRGSGGQGRARFHRSIILRSGTVAAPSGPRSSRKWCLTPFSGKWCLTPFSEDPAQLSSFCPLKSRLPFASTTERAFPFRLPSRAREPLTVTVSPILRESRVQPRRISPFGLPSSSAQFWYSPSSPSTSM